VTIPQQGLCTEAQTFSERKNQRKKKTKKEKQESLTCRRKNDYALLLPIDFWRKRGSGEDDKVKGRKVTKYLVIPGIRKMSQRVLSIRQEREPFKKKGIMNGVQRHTPTSSVLATRPRGRTMGRKVSSAEEKREILPTST